MRKEYQFLDVTKLVLSLMVVAIHINPLSMDLGNLRFPVTRTAVPIFFMISSYLLFEKIGEIGDPKAKRLALWKFVKRNLQLYFTWFCLLFPIMAYARGYFDGGILVFLSRMLIMIPFGSTFIASWYIMALVLGVPLVYLISRYLGNTAAVIVGVVCYGVCCLASNYGNLFSETSWIIVLREWYPTDIYNSFPVAVLWLAIGKWMADHRCLVQKKSPVFTGGGACVCLLGLYMEHLLIQKINCCYENDCYFMLVPTCVLLFATALNVKTRVPLAKNLRQLSTVLYCCHGALAIVFGWLLRGIGVDTGAFPGATAFYLIVVFVCVLVSLLISTLRRFRFFSWLQYLV